ncbi:MAG: hypothetical protein ACXWML_10735 [Candidatus Binataceae bacterium]
MDTATENFCLYLRTKSGYFRSPEGRRLIDPDSSTACYRCLLTQSPVGPDGLPCDARQCTDSRSCFKEEN